MLKQACSDVSFISYLSLTVGSLVTVFITESLSAVIQPLQGEEEMSYFVNQVQV